MSSKTENNRGDSMNQHTPVKYMLQAVGSVLILIGAISYSITSLAGYSGWIIAVGGIIGALGYILDSDATKKHSKRVRRLDRMTFLSMLLYVVAGGFMIDSYSTKWLVIFTIATVFFIYSVFVKDRALKKENN